MGGAESSLLSTATIQNNMDDMPAWALCVFEFSDWRSRVNMMMISKRWFINTKTQHFYRFLASRLSIEHGVYVPSVLPASYEWYSLFQELYKLRFVWRPVDDVWGIGNQKCDGTIGTRFKISVYARFRPSEKESEENLATCGDNGDIEVTLPLHQKLAMIRMSRKLNTNRQALKVLTTEGGWFQARWSQLNNSQNVNDPTNSMNSRNGISFDADQNVPPKFIKNTTFDGGNDKTSDIILPDQQQRMVASVQNIDTMAGRVVMVAPDVGLREFSFDGVLPLHASQKSMYDTSARRLVMDFINGFNSTAIVYGQTGLHILCICMHMNTCACHFNINLNRNLIDIFIINKCFSF